VEKHHEFSDGLLLTPPGRDTGKARLADPTNFEQPLWRALDDIKDLITKSSDKPVGKVRPYALDHARAEVARDAFDRRWRHHLQKRRTKLLTVRAMLLPSAARLNMLAFMHVGGRTQDCNEVAMPPHLHAQHAEAGLRAVEM
jgi:hypothetical protein